jgi:hypothetical protein
MKSAYQVFKGSRIDFKTVGDASNALSFSITAADLVVKGKNGIGFQGYGTGLITYQLPAALPGYQITFQHKAVGGSKIVPASGETLQSGAGALGTANQYISNTVAGNSITLECLVAGAWITKRAVGTWGLT